MHRFFIHIAVFFLVFLGQNIFAATPSMKSSVQSNCSNPNGRWFSKFRPDCAHIMLQTGIFNSSPGSAQNIGIEGLIGNRFTVSNHHAQNILFGLGYFANGLEQPRFSLIYGINAFYLAQVGVKGTIIQEQLFTNLSYHYSITNYPIYFAGRVLINNDGDKYNIFVDLGVGPNIIRTSGYQEGSLDGGITIPDQMFSANTSVALSATAGLGIKFNHIMGHVPLEFGYRFFYLGQGYLHKANPQVSNTLSTGSNYVNALIVAMDL